MANEELDLESLSLEELAALATQELQQPRDEQGRFSKQEQVSSEEEQPAEEVDEIVYRRVIDLEDGSGTQVFEAESPEALIEKLAEAQKHATRKIRELVQAQKPKEEPKVDADDEFVLSQEMLHSPTKGFQKLFQRATGMTVDEFNQERAENKKLTQGQQEFNAGQEFQTLEPNYFPTPKNGVKIEKWLRINTLPGTVENIQKAYADLSESGLLETGPQNNDAKGNTGETVTSRIANTGTTVSSVRRAASGVSSRRVVPTIATTPTEDDLYSMPLDKLAELANRSRI